MLHRLSGVLERFKRRSLGLLKYISDYKILLFSLTYIFFTYLCLKLLRNIEVDLTIGWVGLVSSTVAFLLVKFYSLRNIEKGSVGVEGGEDASKRIVHFFGIDTILVLAVLDRKSVV
jgi:hypothetical protein